MKAYIFPGQGAQFTGMGLDLYERSALAQEYFEKAITSLKTQQVEFEELVIVHTGEESLVTILNNYDFGNLTVTKLLWDKTPNYCDQVNYGIKNAKGTWISLFELVKSNCSGFFEPKTK